MSFDSYVDGDCRDRPEPRERECEKCRGRGTLLARSGLFITCANCDGSGEVEIAEPDPDRAWDGRHDS